MTSKYSINYKGKQLVFGFRKQMDGCWIFYLGDIVIGQIFNLGRTWSGVSLNPHYMNGLEGFKTRLDACFYLLKLDGYIKN